MLLLPGATDRATGSVDLLADRTSAQTARADRLRLRFASVADVLRARRQPLTLHLDDLPLPPLDAGRPPSPRGGGCLQPTRIRIRLRQAQAPASIVRSGTVEHPDPL